MKKLFMFLAILGCLMMVTGNANAFLDPQANATAGAGASVVQEDNSVNNVNDYKLVNPGVTPLPQTNGFFTAPTPDSSFRSIQDIIRVLTLGDGVIRFNEAALREMAAGGSVDVHVQILRGPTQVPRAYEKGNYTDKFTGEETKLNKFLTITIEKPVVKDGKVVGMLKPEGIKPTGLIDGEATDGDTNSLQVLGAIGLKAIADGNNFMVITAEGAHRMVTASGWGVGFYGVTSGISDTGSHSNVGGGGTGYASNKTGTEDKPWVQGYVGVVKEGAIK